MLVRTNGLLTNNLGISFFKSKKYMWSSIQLCSISNPHVTADSVLEHGDTELAKKTQSMLSWSLRRQKINISGGEKCLFQSPLLGNRPPLKLSGLKQPSFYVLRILRASTWGWTRLCTVVLLPVSPPAPQAPQAPQAAAVSSPGAAAGKLLISALLFSLSFQFSLSLPFVLH